jgi:hypothetical protein
MKRIIIKALVIVVFVIIAGSEGKAQTNINLLDLSIMPIISVDNAEQDSIELMVNFKINKPENAAKVHFWMGTAKDSSDILSVTPVFNTTSGKSKLTYNSISTEVVNYQASFKVKLLAREYSSLVKATLFVETKTGQLTSRLYF